MVRIQQPLVSIIICHHAGTSLIKGCLNSVFQSQGIGAPRKEYEVFVMSSNPALLTATRYYQLVEHQGGPDVKRNAGVKLARGKYLVFLDDDVTVTKDCIANLIKGYSVHPTMGMGFCKIYNMERRHEFDDAGSFLTPTGFMYARAQDQFDTGQYDEDCKILASKSATCIITKDLFVAIGGFDESYFILGEETDLAWRVWLSGSEVWYLHQPNSYHAFGTSLKPAAKYYTAERIHFHGCKNYLNVILTNLGCRRLVVTFPLLLLGWSVSAVGLACSGNHRRAWLILQGMWWNLSMLRHTLRKRRLVQKTRKISDRTLMKIILYKPGWRYYWSRLSRYLVRGLHG